MSDAIIVTIAVEVLKYGTPLMLFAVLVALVIWQWMRVSLKNSDKKSAADRSEHMAKWQSLIDQQRETVLQLTQAHRQEMDRQFKLYESMAETMQLQTGLMAKLNEKVDANRFCPAVRGDRPEGSRRTDGGRVI